MPHTCSRQELPCPGASAAVTRGVNTSSFAHDFATRTTATVTTTAATPTTTTMPAMMNGIGDTVAWATAGSEDVKPVLAGGVWPWDVPGGVEGAAVGAEGVVPVDDAGVPIRLILSSPVDVLGAAGLPAPGGV